MTLLSLSSAPEATSVAAGATFAQPDRPVLACRDALRARSAEVEVVAAHSDAGIDAVLRTLPEARLVVAARSDGQLRAVLRRLVRRYAPAPSARPADLPADRTVPDLPPIGLLRLGPAGIWLGVPDEPAEVAAAVLGGRTRRFDLLRTDAGSVSLDGALLGAVDPAGRPVPFAARVEVDDAVLSDGGEGLLAVAVVNADGYASFDGLPLVVDPDAGDGVLDVAVALPASTRGRFGRRRPGFEVRRGHGRAVAISPRESVPLLDDGVPGTLSRKRTWWLERAAWAVYVR